MRSRLGIAVALDEASVFVCDQTRTATEAQPLASLSRLETHNPRLAAAVALMKRHLENPLPTSAIARRVGISTRTLEMLFTAGIGETPGAYALRLRLNVARRLVLDTTASMASIATRCAIFQCGGFFKSLPKGSRPGTFHLSKAHTFVPKWKKRTPTRD